MRPLHQADRDVDPATIGTMRTKDCTLKQISVIQSQQTARQKAALRTQYGLKDSPNALLDLPLDLHRYDYRCTCYTVFLYQYMYMYVCYKIFLATGVLQWKHFTQFY